MDEIIKFNKERWEDLARNDVIFSRPFLDLDSQSARQILDPMGIMGDVNGKNVLCLASGGGQQSVAFGLLGAKVTVFDLSETQLQRDVTAAEHYHLHIQTVQGDMRDLSAFDDAAFDLVWHAYSINFVPQTEPVFREVARVLRVGGLYRLEFSNPFTFALDEAEWDGTAYPLRQPYLDGVEADFVDQDWEIWNDDGTNKQITGPKEFRHTLSTIINGLVKQGLLILNAREEVGDSDAPPGSWEHLTSIAPPWLTFWAMYQPEASPGLIAKRND